MRRSMNGTRSATSSSSSVNGPGSLRAGGGMTRRATTNTDENHAGGDNSSGGGGGRAGGIKKEEVDQMGFAGPVTARLKMLEKRYAQVLEIQAKFQILDKWIQQQFGMKMFPPAVVNMEKFEQEPPEDVDNPFYAVYLVIQRVKFLEEKVKKLEARPLEEVPEPKPTSNYSSAHAFRNFNRGGGKGPGGVKRSYNMGSNASSPSTTPKKAKMLPRQVIPPSSNYPFKPSVKILPRDPSMPSPAKKDKEETSKDSKSPTKAVEEVIATKSEPKPLEKSAAETAVVASVTDGGSDKKAEEVATGEKMDTDEVATDKDAVAVDAAVDEEKPITGDVIPSASQESVIVQAPGQVEIKEEVKEEEEEHLAGDDVLPILEDSTADLHDDDMVEDSGQEDGDMEVEQKADIIPGLGEEETGDISGSEASVSSQASSSKPRLSTRRSKAVATASTSKRDNSADKTTGDDDVKVMYTARGRRHTVPRRYAEFTGHDNVVSILKSQQRAEKTAAAQAGSSKGGRRQQATPTKNQDTPPKIKKMVKTVKSTPSPKKLPIMTDSDGEGEPGPSKKKPGPNAVSTERPPCVDALVDRVMAREVDSDGMVVLAESYPNIYVNQQQLITVIVRSNGKSTRLTRKMTTLVFEDSVLASASPFGTKYYKDRLPPEPLEAMVDFIADSGFEPHYSKKKIYMIVGQVCNEARAGRVSRKFMQPLEATPGGSQFSQETPSPIPASPTPESSPQ